MRVFDITKRTGYSKTNARKMPMKTMRNTSPMAANAAMSAIAAATSTTVRIGRMSSMRRGSAGSIAGTLGSAPVEPGFRGYRPGMADWDVVREVALSLAEVEESTTGRIAFSVRGKGFAWEARERDGGGLAVRVDREEKLLILDANPDAYFTSPHYAGYPAVQIRVERIDRDELRARLEDAWLIQAPKRLAAQYLAQAD
jgi:hypothetical protein